MLSDLQKSLKGQVNLVDKFGSPAAQKRNEIEEKMKSDIKGLPNFFHQCEQSEQPWNTLMKKILNDDITSDDHQENEVIKFVKIRQSTQVKQQPRQLRWMTQKNYQKNNKRKKQNISFNDKDLFQQPEKEQFETNIAALPKMRRPFSCSGIIFGTVTKKQQIFQNDYPLSQIEQHKKDEIFNHNRRSGLLGRMRTILLKHSKLVTTLNFWTKDTQKKIAKKQQRKSNMLHPLDRSTGKRGTYVVRQAELIGRSSENFVWQVEQNINHHQSKFLNIDEEIHSSTNQVQRPYLKRNSKKKVTIDFSSSSSSSSMSNQNQRFIKRTQQLPEGLDLSQQPVRKSKMFSVIKSNGMQPSQTITDFVKRNSSKILPKTLPQQPTQQLPNIKFHSLHSKQISAPLKIAPFSISSQLYLIQKTGSNIKKSSNRNSVISDLYINQMRKQLKSTLSIKTSLFQKNNVENASLRDFQLDQDKMPRKKIASFLGKITNLRSQPYLKKKDK